MILKWTLSRLISSTLAVVYASMAVLLFLVLSQIHLSESSLIEQELAQKDIQRILLGLDSIRAKLIAHHNEWSVWDESYNYIKGSNDKFAETYLENLDGLTLVSHYIFLDDHRRIVSSGWRKYEEQQILPIEDGTLDFILNRADIPQNKLPLDQLKETSGLVVLDGEPHFFVSGPITSVEGTEGAGGILIFTMRLSKELFSEVQKQTNLPLAYTFKGNSQFVEKLRIYFASDIRSGETALRFGEDGNITAFGLIRDYMGSPVAVLETFAPEQIYTRSKSTLRTVLGWVIVFAAVTIILTALLINWYVLRPLNKLTSELSEVSNTKNSKLRLSPQRGLEFELVVTGVNKALDSLNELEIELTKARDAAQAANLAKSTFVAKVSHELRTPIHSIVGMLRILFKEERSTAKRDYIKMARDAAYSLLGTINDILDFSKIESGNLTIETVPLNLREIARETLRTVGPRAEEKESLELVGYVDPKVPDALLGDPLRLKQSIINLLSNAIKFTAAGSVEVDIALAKSSPSEAEIIISVRDTGVGIPEHRLQKIFDPFTQADESVARVFQGTGLGLTIVKQLVEAMGGNVSVTSRVGLGTDFILRIPLKRQQPAADWELPTPIKSGKVVVVDTQTAASEQWRKFLRLQSFIPVWVNSQDNDALEKLSSIAADSEFVVLSEEALQRSAVFNFVVEAASTKNGPQIVAVLSPFAISLREKLLSLSITNVLVRPCLPDDILLSLAGKLAVADQVWDGDVDFVAEVNRPMRILIADDTYTNRFILQSMLEEGGHTVTAVTNGQELFDILSASIADPSADKFDLVFTDVQMPIMDGITATTKIRDIETGFSNVHTTIVAVTAHAMTEEKSKMRDSGVDDVITKPVEPSEVARVLAKASENPDGSSPSNPVNPYSVKTPIRQTKILIGNEVNLEAVAEKVWKQFLSSGGNLGELVQSAVDGEELISDKESLHKFLNVQETYERSGGSMRRTMMIFRAFLSSFKDVLAQVAHAKSERNAEELRKASHTLKGLLLEVGAKSPGSTAGNVEQLCNKGQIEEALKLINPVTHQTLAAARIVEKIVEAVEEEQNEQKDGTQGESKGA